MLGRDLVHAMDPVTFAAEALGFQADPMQQKVLRWSGKRLLLNCTRQWGKSTTTAVLASHTALFWPASLILLISPSLRQSGELFRKVSEFMSRMETKPALIEDNKLSMQLENGSRIVSLPSTEATIRGFSAPALVIEDEAARVDDVLYKSVRPMLAVSGGRLILMSTPFGKRGHFHEEFTAAGPAWERIAVAAPDCPRISPAFLDEERKAMGDWWFRQEYMCEFVETTDQIFGYEEIMATISSEVKPLFSRDLK